MNKTFFGILAILSVVAFNTSFAQRMTNTIAATEDLSVRQDFSDYPTQSDPFGLIVRNFNAAYDDPEVGNNVLTGDSELGDGAVIIGGFIEVLTPVTPAAATTNVVYLGTNILLASGTSLGTAGYYPIASLGGTASGTTAMTFQRATVYNTNDGAVVSAVTNGTAATTITFTPTTPFVLGSEGKVNFTTAGTAITQGVFNVYLQVIHAQP